MCHVITLAFLHKACIIFLSWLAMLYDSLSYQVLVSAPQQVADFRTRGLKVFACNSPVLCGLEGFWWVNSKDRYRLECPDTHPSCLHLTSNQQQLQNQTAYVVTNAIVVSS